MSKLTQEQKAEAYEKALEKAREALKDGEISFNAIAYLQDIFPELKEAEDEKIRKWLIEYFNKYIIDGMLQVYGLNVKDVIAWLEKQDKNVINFSDNEKCLDEPKFKVGDWVVLTSDNSVHKVEEIGEDEYTLRNVLGETMYLSFALEHLARLWVIKDAKDGDILATSEGQIIIFRKIRNKIRGKNAIEYHCIYYKSRNLVFTNGTFIYQNNELFTPAIKEQRETLLEAMIEGLKGKEGN